MEIFVCEKEDFQNWFYSIIDSYDDEKMIKIMNKIFHVIASAKWKSCPPSSKQLKNIWDEILYELRVSFSCELRINYFIDESINSIVILNAYEKPNWAKDKNSYNKKNKSNISKFIKSIICEALDLKKEYNLNKRSFKLLDL